MNASHPSGRPISAPRSNVHQDINKLAKRLRRETSRAIADYNMIQAGDRVMVCMSGGKDSYGLLDMLLHLRSRAPFSFELIAVNLDQKQPGFPEHVLPTYLQARQVPFHIETRDTYAVVTRLIPAGKTMCSLCSRLRRGILYRVADELGATKIALGHHRDDIVGTFFLNLFYGAKLKAMPPKLVSDDGRHTVIRPLAYVAEKDLASWAASQAFPIIPCNLCGSQQNLKRLAIKHMLEAWERQQPGRVWNIFRALSNIVPSHLMDRQHFDFANLHAHDHIPGESSVEHADHAADPNPLAANQEAEPMSAQHEHPPNEYPLNFVHAIRNTPTTPT